MSSKNRRRIARVTVLALWLPLAPFYVTAMAASALHDWIDGWQWPHKISSVAERVHLWSIQ